jgi:hypothetical protein
MFKILIKSFFFLALTLAIFNAFGMETEEFFELFKEEKHPELFEVFKEEDNDFEKYSEYIKTPHGNYLITCTLGKSERFAGQKACYAIKEMGGAQLLNNELFEQFKRIYKLQQKQVS